MNDHFTIEDEVTTYSLTEEGAALAELHAEEQQATPV